jgi:hypothetical protein
MVNINTGQSIETLLPKGRLDLASRIKPGIAAQAINNPRIALITDKRTLSVSN